MYKVDDDHSTSTQLIGIVTNKSQQLLSVYWDNLTNGNSVDAMMDSVSKLVALFGISIDLSKEKVDLEIMKVVKAIDKSFELKNGNNLRLVIAKENIAHYYNKKEERERARRLTIEQIQRIKFVATRLKLINRYKQNNISNYYSNLFNVDYVSVFNLLVGNTHKNVESNNEQKLEINLLIVEQEAENIEIDYIILKGLSA